MSKKNLLAAAQSALRLEDVYLRSVSASLAADFMPAFMGKVAQIHVQTRFSTEEHRVVRCVSDDPEEVYSCIEYRLSFDARFLSEKLVDADLEQADVVAEKKLAEVSAMFAVLYRIVTEVDEDALQAFGIQNAPLHAWPYWRELLQTASSRLKLPSPILPMFKGKKMTTD